MERTCRRLRVLAGHTPHNYDARFGPHRVSGQKNEVNHPKVGFVGGGQMATALATGMVSSRFTTPENVIASDVFEPSRKSFEKQTGCRTCERNKEAIEGRDIVVLAVKPQVMPMVLKEMQSIFTKYPQGQPLPLLVSIVAGFTSSTILAGIKGSHDLPLRLIRVMPNTPALIGKGASAFSLSGNATKEDAATVKKLLEGVGLASEVPEKLLDAVTGLSGSGPAYVYQFIEAMSDGGVSVGIPRELATKLAAQTVLGAAEMVLQTGEHPAVLKDRVASPAGTTIAAIHALESGGVRASVINAVRAATQRSIELGKQD